MIGFLNLPRPHEGTETQKSALIQVVNTSSASVNIPIKIQEAYREYQPPFDFTRTVEKLLATVPQKYLSGLGCIVLVNQSSLPRRDRVGRIRSRRRKVDKFHILGRYHKQWAGSQPYIELRVDRIILSLDIAGFPKIKLLRELGIGYVLFHEIGHHIHATMRPEYLEKEDVADHWAGKLGSIYVRKTYWYLVPLLIPALRIFKVARQKQWI